MPLRAFAAAAALLIALVGQAAAIVHPGDIGPNFTKNRLDYPALGQTTPVSLYEYSGKVIVLFILGYS
jgi:hypothetical protein